MSYHLLHRWEHIAVDRRVRDQIKYLIPMQTMSLTIHFLILAATLLLGKKIGGG